jgi:hypothetical protein
MSDVSRVEARNHATSLPGRDESVETPRRSSREGRMFAAHAEFAE